MDSSSTQPAEETTQQRVFRRSGEGSNAMITLGARDLLVGRLVYEGDLRVQGTFEGEASVSGDLSVESQGTVKAKIDARNLNVRGTLDGEATARERLLISGSGSVTGTIKVARLAVEDGALLNGTITMERSSPGINGRRQAES
jgi:cytoskeletal protein CcmA (bactofilin family)